MRRQMEKERAEMRLAMEASIQQRVADEAGDQFNTRVKKTVNNQQKVFKGF